MIDEAEVLTQLAEAASGPPYFYRPIPCELDWKIAEVVEFLMQATEDARAVLLQRAKTDGLLGVLGAAAARLATLAVATSDVTLLRRAMAAMAMMGGFRDNPREASLEVGRVYAAALALHKSPRRLLKWGARFARSADDASDLITFAESKRDPWKGLPWGEYSPFRGGASSPNRPAGSPPDVGERADPARPRGAHLDAEIGRASCRERV